MEHVHIYKHKSQVHDTRTQALFRFWCLASLCVSIARTREEVKTSRMKTSKQSITGKVRQQLTYCKGRHVGKVRRQLERNA